MIQEFSENTSIFSKKRLHLGFYFEVDDYCEAKF